MTQLQALSEFVQQHGYEDLSAAAVDQLKIRVLDALGCALGALNGEPIRMLRGYLAEVGGEPRATLIGAGRSSVDRAAFYNAALVRYLDYNDSYLAPGETCHPSDNLAPVLAAAERAGASGRELLVALALAYQVQCRLSDEAPVRDRGFDHTTQGSYAVAAGVSRALGLDPQQTANAIAISGTAFNALRVTRTGTLSHWKGLAYPNTAFVGTHAALLAQQGITGPAEVFEGNKGFMQAIAGPFTINWLQEDLERVTATIIKKYNAEIHSQSAIEALLELAAEHGFAAGDVEHIEVGIFDVAHKIIGGGEEGEKTAVASKEEADHSLPYILAVALLDGQVMPSQYRPERIAADDVQGLMRRITVQPVASYSERFPAAMPCRVTVRLVDGRELSQEKSDYEGFQTRPMAWATVRDKFERLSTDTTTQALRSEIEDAVQRLEAVQVSDLAAVLARAGPQ